MSFHRNKRNSAQSKLAKSCLETIRIFVISILIILTAGCNIIVLPDSPQSTTVQLDDASTNTVATVKPVQTEVPSASNTDDTSTATTSNNIPKNATLYNGHYYKIYPVDAVPINTSPEDFCRDQGGYMAALTTNEENDWAGRYMYTQGFRNALFGMYYDIDKDESKWINGDPVDFTCWWNGDPEISAGTGYASFVGWDIWDGLQEITEKIDGNYHTEADRSYQPSLLIDGDPTTAWVEGVSGTGIGESVIFEFKESVVIFSVMITNGYQKREDLYYRNSRPKRIQLTFEDEDYSNSQEFELTDEMGIQELELDPIVFASRMTLTVLDVYPGTEFEDTAISEIDIMGIYPTFEWNTTDWNTATSELDQIGVLCEWESDISPSAMIEDSSQSHNEEQIMSWEQLPSLFAHEYSHGGILIDIEPDGALTGDYHTLYRGDSGDSYPDGTMYYCNFSSSLSRPFKVADAAYQCQMTPIESEDTYGAVGYEAATVDGSIRTICEPPWEDTSDSIEVMLFGPGCSQSVLESICPFVVIEDSLYRNGKIRDDIWVMILLTEDSGLTFTNININEEGDDGLGF